MLADYLPPLVRDVKEIACILQAENGEFDVIRDKIRRNLDNSFAALADENGIKRWEKLYGIIPRTANFEERRQEILTRLNDRLPYTRNSLNQALTVLYGDEGRARHSLEIDCKNYVATVYLALDLEESFGIIERFLRRRVPANMRLEVFLVFKRHGALKRYTHGELSEYTHLKIKRGEMI